MVNWEQEINEMELPELPHPKPCPECGRFHCPPGMMYHSWERRPPRCSREDAEHAQQMHNWFVSPPPTLDSDMR